MLPARRQDLVHAKKCCRQKGKNRFDEVKHLRTRVALILTVNLDEAEPMIAAAYDALAL